MEDFKDLETELKIEGCSDQTIRTYIYQNQKFLKYLNQNARGEHQRTLGTDNKRGVLTVTQNDVKSYIAYLVSDKKLSRRTINLVLSALTFFYDKMHNLAVVAGIKRKYPPKKLPHTVTKKEMKSMLDATSKKKHKLLLALLYGSGLRVSETVTLKRNQVHIDERKAIIRSGKGDKDRQVPLSRRFCKMLTSYLKKSRDKNPYIFNYRDNHLSSRQAQRIVSNAAIRAGLDKPVHCHMLRASFATELLNSGVDIITIQTVLGHEDVSTTQVYTAVSKERLESIRSPGDTL
tara:strand:+ start:855 stop:1724 length:870 start_codon:yes stop_codon:yes gene_type:complete